MVAHFVECRILAIRYLLATDPLCPTRRCRDIQQKRGLTEDLVGELGLNKKTNAVAHSHTLSQFFEELTHESTRNAGSAFQIANCSYLGGMRFVFALLFLATLHVASAVEIEGVNVPPQIQVGGQALQLNGAGLRTVVLLIIPIKAYVAGFYATAPLRSEADVLASAGPLGFTFTFLKSVGQGQVTSAWTAQFADSNTFTYAGFEKDRDAFIALFGPLQSGGVESVQLVGTDTLVYDSGKFKGTISGRNFQRAFLSLWFGSTPVMPSLKSALLGT